MRSAHWKIASNGWVLTVQENDAESFVYVAKSKAELVEILTMWVEA